MRAVFPLLVLLGGGSAAQVERLHVWGSEPGERLGAEVGVIGDLDGDGVPEWLVARGAATAEQARPELLVLSGRDGRVVHDVLGVGPINDLFLQSVLDLGDVDGDAVPDFAFGNSTARVNGQPNRGRVSVFSGSTGRRLHFTEGPVSSGAFGGALARIGDVDRDGLADFVVGQIGTDDENVWLVSAASGALLAHVKGPRGGDPEFGWDVAAAGDLDQDGIVDFAVGTLRKGIVNVYSSATRRLLRTFGGSRSFGRELAELGDVDGDGSPELLIAESTRRVVWIASPRRGPLVPVVVEGTVGALDRAGDLDGDGLADFWVGVPSALGGAGLVRGFSSRGRELFRLAGTHGGQHLGASLAGGADFDADGRPDLVLGAPDEDGPRRGASAGAASVWSPGGGLPGGRGAPWNERVRERP